MSEASAPQLVAKSKKAFLQDSTSSQEFDDYRIKPLARLVYSTPFELAIAFVIMANAIALAVLTFPNIRPATDAAAELVDAICFAIYSIELIIRLISYGKKPWMFFKQGWN